MNYYKGTRNDGKSYHDPRYRYHIGLNEEPDYDDDDNACGKGLHLSKSIKFLQSTRNNDEIYLARPGVILGEDGDKVRCKYVWIDRLLTKSEIGHFRLKEDYTNVEAIVKSKFPGIPLCGIDWLVKHYFDYTDADIERLTISVSSDKGNFTLHNHRKLTKEAIKAVLRMV